MKKNQFTKTNGLWLAIIILVFVLLKVLISAGIIGNVGQTLLLVIGINIILAISLNLIIGITGQFSLGHAGFMAIGAYGAGIMIKMLGESYSSVAIGILVGLVVTGIIALIVAIPTLRLKGDYLAIATLGISETIRILIQNLKITNGAAGLVLPKLVGWELVYVFVALTTLIVVNFTNSAQGRACISIRENEIAAETMGINTTKFKTIAFVLGAMIASIAGSLYALSFYVIRPEMFSFNKSIEILVTVVFGGLGSFTGSYLASIVLGLINQALQQFADIRMIIYGLSLVILMIFRPQGLLGNREIKLSKLFDKDRGDKNANTGD